MTDFGRASRDYAAYRKGFPPSFFERLAALGIRGRLLDLGTGTGSIARAMGGTGLDRSVAMLREAPDLPRVCARAERAPFRDGAFDVVTAGQAWIWFDGSAVARESFRILRPGGRLVVAHFDYLPEGGTLSEETERLILRYNPGWVWAGLRPRDRQGCDHLEAAGFRDLSYFEYREAVEYSHEGWRGRFRACNGVIELWEPARIEAFDADLTELLKRQPDPVTVPHRITALIGTRPSGG